MCTHDEEWAYGTMDQLLRAIDVNLKPAAPKIDTASIGVPGPSIQVIKRTDSIGQSQLRFTALVWSPLTAPLKRQLAFDMTGEPTNCATDQECKPKRAKFNGLLKETLLNDCLADALVYEGAGSREAIRSAMVGTLMQVLEDADPSVPLVLVSSSLGSKLAFDALSVMVATSSSGASIQAGKPAAPSKASARLSQVFMNANQLPILGLADQNVAMVQAPGAQVAPSPDALQRYLRLRQQEMPLGRLKVVAFTDPNDLLSYRLQPSRYATESVEIADVLVSNAKTYAGLIERPDIAHRNYLTNPNVATLIACGNPKSVRCK